MYTIQTFNTIAPKGLARFPNERYTINPDADTPDAILLRSHNLHDHTLPTSVKAVARAGAGYNNIPIDLLSAQGIPAFNTPGANANAVKELVLTGMLLACRNIHHALEFTQTLNGDDESIKNQVEQGKKQFVGYELPGRTLGIIGLGAIGVKVANMAESLGMRVIGFDPHITVQRAWELSSTVEQARSIDDVLSHADFLSLHVPFMESTQHMIAQDEFNKMKSELVLLNFSREGIVNDEALVQALHAGKVSRYVCDFPNKTLMNTNNVIVLPHLGASTQEAEENCAVMACEQLMAFLEKGTIYNSINFPETRLACNGGVRLAIANANVPNMVGQVSTTLANAKLNILDMINKSRGEIAYTLIDINTTIPEPTLQQIKAIDGILSLRIM